MLIKLFESEFYLAQEHEKRAHNPAAQPDPEGVSNSVRNDDHKMPWWRGFLPNISIFDQPQNKRS
jgi:hypothetical protein